MLGWKISEKPTAGAGTPAPLAVLGMAPKCCSTPRDWLRGHTRPFVGPWSSSFYELLSWLNSPHHSQAWSVKT